MRPQVTVTPWSLVSKIPCSTFHRSRTSHLQISLVRYHAISARRRKRLTHHRGLHLLTISHTPFSLIWLAVMQHISFTAICSVDPLRSPWNDGFHKLTFPHLMKCRSAVIFCNHLSSVHLAGEMSLSATQTKSYCLLLSCSPLTTLKMNFVSSYVNRG